MHHFRRFTTAADDILKYYSVPQYLTVMKQSLCIGLPLPLLCLEVLMQECLLFIENSAPSNIPGKKTGGLAKLAIPSLNYNPIWTSTLYGAWSTVSSSYKYSWDPQAFRVPMCRRPCLSLPPIYHSVVACCLTSFFMQHHSYVTLLHAWTNSLATCPPYSNTLYTIAVAMLHKFKPTDFAAQRKPFA